MALAKIRVYELAKELGVESKELLQTLNDMGEFVRSASSTVEPAVVRRLKERQVATPKLAARVIPGTSERARLRPWPQLLNPVDLVQPGRRLFIDTNVFMDTHPARAGGLKRLFELCSDTIRSCGNPVIVPTKVVDELTRQSQLSGPALTKTRHIAVQKAKNALVFIAAAEREGLVRRDLGDGSNPYADDLFVRLFQSFAGTYGMCLLTFDITLQLRIRLLATSIGQPVLAGRLTKEGMVEIDSEQALYERGLNKHRQKARIVAEGSGGRADRSEVASLEPLVAEFQRVFGVGVPASVQLDGRRTGLTVPDPALAARRVAGAFDPRAKLQADDRVLAACETPGEGADVLYESPTGSGRLVLREQLGAGGEGTVFAVDGGRVVKIFDPDHVTKHRREKLNLLVSRGLKSDGICFPEAVVLNRFGQFVGYLMPKAKGMELSRTIFRPKRFVQVYPDWKKADLVDVCISFLEKVAYLHGLNIILGDINPKNLLVDANKEVWIIDADSWQLEGYPCPVGTAMFTAPALAGKRYPEFLRTMEDERFAVATILFMILITGQFPYARAGSDGDIVRLIRDGNFAFQYKENSNKDQPEGNWKYMWSHLPPRLKEMFWNTFHRSGSRYRKRPSAQDWLQAFRDYRTYLGSSESFDPMSNDVYPTRFKAFRPDTPIYACPECRRPFEVTGIWRDDTQSYDKPTLCFNCRSATSARQTPTAPVVAAPRPSVSPPIAAPRLIPTTRTKWERLLEWLRDA